MNSQDKYINALISLHTGLERQGPGDPEFTRYILNLLTDLPANPVIADLGCGAGAGALILAEIYHTRVRAVDFSKPFLDQMMSQAEQKGLADLIEPVECDMGELDWELQSIDLLWSEGAAYNISFEGAIKSWRPLLTEQGIAVISEMNYFSDNPPDVVKSYMKRMYPDIKNEAENIALINKSGFRFLELHRLPSRAWWDYYYDPLRNRIDSMGVISDPVMQDVIQETEEEMDFFRDHHDEFGYTYYIMQAV